MTTDELESRTRTREMRDRLAVQSIGRLALTQKRADAPFDAGCPTRGDRARPFREPFQGELESCSVTGSRCGLCQLRNEPRSVADRIGLHCFPGCIGCCVVPAEAVVE